MLLPLLLVSTPALAAGAPPHSGVAKERTGPAASDIALFVMAAGGVALARRGMARKAMRRRKD